MVWLLAFFLLPLLIIFVVSFGSRDATGHVILSDLGLRNYIEATKPEFLPAFGNSLRYSLLTTVLSLLIGYPIAYWISRHGGRHKILLLILVTVAVIDTMTSKVRHHLIGMEERR